jgi:hypothetical protein
MIHQSPITDPLVFRPVDRGGCYPTLSHSPVGLLTALPSFLKSSYIFYALLYCMQHLILLRGVWSFIAPAVKLDLSI